MVDVEASPAGEGLDDLSYPDEFEEDVVSEHIELLIEAGYLEGKMLKYIGGCSTHISRLTWKGHDFVQASRDDTVWHKAKEKTKSSAASVTFEVFVELLKAISKSQLGF
jgi:hypothetical protein